MFSILVITVGARAVLPDIRLREVGPEIILGIRAIEREAADPAWVTRPFDANSIIDFPVPYYHALARRIEGATVDDPLSICITLAKSTCFFQSSVIFSRLGAWMSILGVSLRPILHVLCSLSRAVAK